MPDVPRRVLLSGYYGYGNVGDDAILLALTGELTAAGVERILVPAGPLVDQLALPPTVTVLPRFGLRPIKQALRDGAVVISGGGGLLQDATSVRSLVYYLGILTLARRAGRPYAICAQSIGPLEHRVSRRAVRLAVQQAAAVSVRDPRSAAALAELGVAPDLVRVTADPVFSFPAPTPAAPPAPLAICLRHTDHTATVLTALREAWDRLPAPAYCLACQEADDEVHGSLSAMLGDRPLVRLPRTSVQQTQALLAGSELVIGVRLHALIFAAVSGTPSVAIDYDPKVRGLAEAFELPLAGTDSDLTAAALATCVQAAWDARGDLSKRLLERADAARERFRADLGELLAALVGGQGA